MDNGFFPGSVAVCGRVYCSLPPIFYVRNEWSFPPLTPHHGVHREILDAMMCQISVANTFRSCHPISFRLFIYCFVCSWIPMPSLVKVKVKFTLQGVHTTGRFIMNVPILRPYISATTNPK
jgi:hypothetical protein